MDSIDLSNVADELERGTERIRREKFFVEWGILEELTEGKNRGIVYNAHDEEQSAKEVPIIWASAADGWGEEHPIQLPKKGLLLVPDTPTPEEIETSEYIDKPSKRRDHEFEDGLFIPGIWMDDEEDLGTKQLEYLYRFPAGAEINVTEESDIFIRHPAGHEVEIVDDQVRVDFARNDGESSEVLINNEEASMRLPDTFNDLASDPQSEISVEETGEAHLNGIARIGDQEAYREDPTNENTDDDDPRNYESVNDPVAPIVDTTVEDNRNADAAQLEGPLNAKWFELRGAVPQRREEDPDPNVTDPTNPAYVDLDAIEEATGTREIPVHTYWHEEDEELKIWLPSEQDSDTIYP